MTAVDKRLVAGFTLIELMIVVLIVAVLAAVAVPIYRGRIDTAKWSEGKAMAGTVASAIRAYAAEKGPAVSATPSLTTDMGFGANDLDGTYFLQACYAVTNVSCTAAGQTAFTITVTAANGRAGYPTTPAAMTLESSAATGYAATWK